MLHLLFCTAMVLYIIMWAVITCYLNRAHGYCLMRTTDGLDLVMALEQPHIVNGKDMILRRALTKQVLNFEFTRNCVRS
jgi:hypothetical protein